MKPSSDGPGVRGRLETEDGLSKGALARRNLSSAAAQNVVGLVATVVRLPLVLHALGPARFGLWTAVLSVASLSAITDFGLQQAVMQRVAELRGQGRADEVPHLVATAFWLSVAAFLTVSFATVTVFVIATPFQHQATGAGVASSEMSTLLVACCLASFAAQPAKLLTTARFGFERMYWLNVWGTFAVVVQIGGLWLLANTHGTLLALGAWTIVWDLAAAVGAAVVLLHRHPDQLSVAWSDRRRGVIRPLATQAGAFFLTTVAGTLRLSVDSIVILAVLGATSVTQYQPTVRLFIVGLGVVPLVFVSLWPGFAESAARDDFEWVARAFRVSSLCVLSVGVTIAAAMTTLGKDLIFRWTGPSGYAGSRVLFVLAAWFLVMTWVQIATHVVISLGGAKSVMRWGLAEGVLNIGLSIVLGHIVGLVGIALGSLIAVFLLGLLPMTIELRTRGKGQVGVSASQVARVFGLAFIFAAPLSVWALRRRHALTIPEVVIGAGVLAAMIGAAIWRGALHGEDRQLIRAQLRAGLRFR